MSAIRAAERTLRGVSETVSDWVPTGAVTVRAPGKVNLYLAVGDLRDDGYHELTTVFHAVSLADDVTVRDADVLSIDVVGQGEGTVPTDERNLAWQAAELFADHVGRAPTSRSSLTRTSPSRAVWPADPPMPLRCWWR